MTTTLSITDVKNDEGTWFWTVTDEAGSTRMKTNRNGEGYWSQKSETEWRQQAGTCQFSLAGKSMAAARAYLRRQFAN